MTKSLKLREYKKTVELPMYNYDVYVTFTSDMQESVSRWEDIHHPDGEPLQVLNLVCGLHMYLTNRGQSFLFFPLDCGVSHIAHESFHVVWRLWRWIGAEHENETMAYTVGHLVREIVLFYNKSVDTARVRRVRARARTVAAKATKRKTKNSKNNA